MSEKHTDIADAKILLVTGETGANLISFTAQLYGAHDCTIAAQFPEGSFMSKEIRQWFSRLLWGSRRLPSIILTRSIFVMREAHMLQKQYAYPVRWFYVKADGSYYQADSMDEIRECEQLDEEVMQADRYMDMEMGLKPRIELQTNQPRDEMNTTQTALIKLVHADALEMTKHNAEQVLALYGALMEFSQSTPQVAPETEADLEALEGWIERAIGEEKLAELLKGGEGL